MINNMQEICKCVELMDKYLRNNLNKKQLWENTYIFKQINKREKGGTFSTSDHICAMVYSMLSSGARWERLENYIDSKTGRITVIDEIFCQYDPDVLLKSSSDKLCNSVKDLHCASRYTLKQVQALIEVNIGRLQAFENQYGSIDNFYHKIIDIDSSLKTLVLILSSPNSPFKMEQMGEALTAEYLRNVGYDIAKPDRHITRILGSGVLGCSDSKTVPVYEAFDIVSQIANKMNKATAEVDYILWSYCASGYGNCTVKSPKCDVCVVKNICNKFRKAE